ncbi:MAG: hypothetical protein GY953_12815, partial [bacterium]|nr:hypothetical protein [bacterium]
MRTVCLSLLFVSVVSAQMPLDGVAVQMTLGIGDREPTEWDGQLQVAARRVVSIEGVSRSGATGWEASSRARKRGMPVPARLTATLRVSAGSTVKVSTSQGDFVFRPSRLGYGVESSFLGGRVT